MRIEVGRPIDDEDRMQTFAFVFHPSTLRLTLVESKQFIRSNEFANWREIGHWFYPDLQNKSTMQEPDVPDWAVFDARFFISEKITYQQ